MEEKKQRIYKTIMLVVLTSFITFLITSLVMYSKLSANQGVQIVTEGSSSGTYSSLNKYLSNVKSILEKYYLWADQIDEDKLQEGAVKGYVDALGDKYTEYIPADEMKEYTEDIKGNFEGIGIYMIADEESNKVLIYYPIPDSPAEKAGIKAGDKIVSINGVEYTAKDLSEISEKIKGQSGTQVTLVVDRNGENLTFTVTREKIETNPITSKIIENDIGYVKIPSFDEDTATEFKQKVEDLKTRGAKSLIIDLRNNGGGMVDVATEMADFMLDKDKIILKTVDNKENEEITKSQKDAIIDMPIVVLVNSNTASSAEILTAALKDNGRAKVVGTKTYGKGIIQSVLSLRDGSGIKITTASYYTPNGDKIHEVGITPDEVVELPDDVENSYVVTDEQDTQLKKAIDMLK